MGSIHKNVMWKNSTSPSVREILLLTQRFLEWLSISHSVLSSSAVMYSQYMWRFWWKRKWQQHFFLGDYEDSESVSFYGTSWEAAEKRGCNFCFFENSIDWHFGSIGQCKKGICSWPHFIIFHLKHHVEAVVFNPEVWLQQRSDCLNCFLNRHEGTDLFTGWGQYNHLFWDQLIFFNSGI